MRDFFKTFFFWVAICVIPVSCGDKDEDNPIDPPTPPPTDTFIITPIEKLNQGTSAINSHADVTSRSSLKMNFRSFIAMGKTELGNDVTTPHYPRIKRMKNGNYILFVNQNEHGGSCYYSISSNLKLWEPKGKIFSSVSIVDLTYGNANTRMFATTDAVVLNNGEILAVASYRARDGGYTKMPLDAGLMLRRSTDNGLSWSEPMAIYQGVNWEPYLLQLASGEIHCYFTDSNRTGAVAKDTGTVMLVSKDNGKTWTPSFGSAPYYVIRSSYQTTYEGKPITCYNDQMPSVIQLNETGELAAAMETARPAPSTAYDISFAYSGDDGQWTLLNPDQKGPEDRNDKAFEGAAPYLGQFPSGETVLSFSRMRMKIGNSKARNFSTSTSDEYTPFSGLGTGYWGSTHIADGHRILSVLPNTSASTIMLAQSILNHRITATRRSVVVDSSNSEWANTDHALFVGEKSQAQGTLRCSFDDSNVYFLVEVLDRSIAKEDYTMIYLNPVTNDNKLTNEACRIKIAFDGLVSTETYNGSSWVSAELGVSVKTKYQNDKTDKGGYFAEIAIPRSKLNIKSGEILTNFSLYDSIGGEDAISSTTSTNTAKWIPIIGL